jgi:Tfp pilus assembly protein PilE
MPKRNNSKNLTFVEIIIVVLVCLFLLAIVQPAFHKARGDASRITCRRNLSLIGKAMLIYSNDYEDEFPRAGGRNSVWSMVIPNWKADNRYTAYGLSPDGSGGGATITSSFYLLVKYTEVPPRSFI